MEEREARDVVALQGRGEGLAWMELGLWLLLVAAAAGQLLTWHVVKLVEVRLPHDLESLLMVNRALGLANSAITLVGTVVVLVSATMSGRLARDGAARILFGVAAAGLVLMVAGHLFGIVLTTEGGSFDPASPLFDVRRWSWLTYAGARALVYIALLLALRRNRAAGQPADDGVLAAVALVSVVHAAMTAAAVVGDPVNLGIGNYGLLVELALNVVLFGGSLVAVRRARRDPSVAAGHADAAAVPGEAGWWRAASGLDLFAGALIARALFCLVGPLGLLFDAVKFTDFGMRLANLVTLLGCLGSAFAMAAGINRVRAAPGPETARLAGVAGLLMLFCCLLDAQFLQLVFRMLSGSLRGDGLYDAYLLRGMAESMTALIAWLALLRCLSSLGHRLGDGARGATAVAVALVIVVLASALFHWRLREVVSWPLAPAMFMPLVGAVATLVVAALFAALARRLAARIRSGAASEPPLARAVARERDGDG